MQIDDNPDDIVWENDKAIATQTEIINPPQRLSVLISILIVLWCVAVLAACQIVATTQKSAPLPLPVTKDAIQELAGCKVKP